MSRGPCGSTPPTAGTDPPGPTGAHGAGSHPSPEPSLSNQGITIIREQRAGASNGSVTSARAGRPCRARGQAAARSEKKSAHFRPLNARLPRDCAIEV